MFSISKTPKCKHLMMLTIVLLAVAKFSTVNSSEEQTNLNRLLARPADQQLLCLKEGVHLTLTSKVVPFVSFYINKVIARTLTVTQIICDLGLPHGRAVAEFETKQHGMPMRSGDVFLQWGENHTNDPSDEVALMVVVNSEGDVTSITRYNTVEKSVTQVVVNGDKNTVSTGNYTNTRTVTTK